MKKRLLAMFLCLTMALGLLPSVAFATEDGADVTEIATVEELKAFAEAVNAGDNFAGKTVKLTADLDLDGEDGFIIGAYDTHPFSGEFDGAGHTISNLTDSTARDHKGLFAYLNCAYVHDLTFKNVNFSGTCEGALYAGALVGEAESKNIIQNVDVEGITWNITSKNGSIGSIAGYSYDSNYINCDVKNAVFNVTSTSSVNMGGMVGQGRGVRGFNTDYGVTSNYSYENCTVDGVTFNVTGKTTVGGFLGCDGYNHWSNSGKKCTVTGLIVNCAADDAQYTVGGFMGSNYGTGGEVAAFDECSTTGTVNAKNNTNTDSAFGGFVGWVGGRAVSMTSCTANVDINVAAGDVGGFCGETLQYFAHAYKFDSCEAQGDVATANGTAGGFIANVQHGGDGSALNVTVTECTVSGNVSGTTANAIIGNINDVKNGASTGGTVTPTDNTVTSDVTVNNAPVTEETMYGGHTELIVQPVAMIGDKTYLTLQAAIAAAEAGDTVTLLADVELADWTSVDVKKAITLDGAGNAITGLTAPLVNNASADFTVKDLTISGASIEIKSADGSDNNTSAAALVQWANGGTLTLNNITVKDSTIKGDGYVAALVGFVDSTATAVKVSGGAISGNTLTAGGTVGAVAGHTYADVTIEGTTISGNTLTSTSDGGTRPDKVGLVVGRLSQDNVAISATVDSTNTVTPGTGTVIGSIPGGTAVMTGGTYHVDPTITGKEGQAASVKEGYEVKDNGDGTYSVVEAKTSVESPYRITTVQQIKLIEPWGLRITFRLRDADNSLVKIDTVSDYGIYFIRERDLNGVDANTLTPDVLATMEGAIKADVTLTANGNDAVAIYDEGVYTYELNEPIYALFYYTTEDGTWFRMVENNLYELALARKDSTSATYSEAEKKVYAAMCDMYTYITAYREELGIQ